MICSSQQSRQSRFRDPSQQPSPGIPLCRGRSSPIGGDEDKYAPTIYSNVASLALIAHTLELPHNLLVIDVPVYEGCLFKAGLRGAMLDAKTGSPRQPSSLLSLRSIIHSLHVPLDFVLHNSGNDAFACLLVFQMLVDPKNTQLPPPRITPTGIGLTTSMTYGSLPLHSPTLLTPPMMAAAAMPRSHSASNIPHLGTGERLTVPRPLSTASNRLSIGDARASAGAADEEGRIDDVSDPLSRKFIHATTIG